ncbi:MAG: putative rhamnosyl transferase [Acidobacteriota bacterium]|nr:putative rhamnosyl transferase [Acidobacteriota bacterium]MDH3523285.1 putative rhamnosyl transferase [Acidobacteriota bacterium]
MRHVIVSRFSVPRPGAGTAMRHCDGAWLDSRLALFHRYFVPSVGRLGVPTVLLCSTASAERVAAATAGLAWCTVEEQDDWRGGWSGAPDQMVTRLDSDDALHDGWFAALEAAAGGFEAYCTRSFLRFHPATRSLYARSRRLPSPLAAFPGGRNPYAFDHTELGGRYRTLMIPGCYLLQVVHGGNLSNRAPSWRHFPLRTSLARLAPFGVEP